MPTFELAVKNDRDAGMVVSDNFAFKITMRDPNVSYFVEGDVFTITGTEKVITDPSLTRVRANGRKSVVQFIYVETENNGKKEEKRLYPSMFMKSVFPVDPETLEHQKRVPVSGSVADEFQKHADVTSAMKALIGKPIKVTKVTPYTVMRYGVKADDENKTTTAYLVTFDFV